MAKATRRTAVVLLALISVLALESAALAAVLGRNGKAVTAVRTVTSSDIVHFTSVDWTDVADMKTFVSVPAGEKAILVITFSAFTSCVATEHAFGDCNIRVLLDGQEVAPGDVQWATTVANHFPDSGVRSMQWVAGPVTAGSHQVKVQAALDTGASFGMHLRTLTVLRSKF